MYVINGKEWDEDKLYKCKSIVAKWLMYTKRIPLFSSDKATNSYYFSKTEALTKALSEMPLYLNIVKAL